MHLSVPHTTTPINIPSTPGKIMGIGQCSSVHLRKGGHSASSPPLFFCNFSNLSILEFLTIIVHKASLKVIPTWAILIVRALVLAYFFFFLLFFRPAKRSKCLIEFAYCFYCCVLFLLLRAHYLYYNWITSSPKNNGNNKRHIICLYFWFF